MTWYPIDTAPKDGTMIVLATIHQRSGHDRVKCGWWEHRVVDRWILKDENTQVRGPKLDKSGWRAFGSFDSEAEEANDMDEGEFVWPFEPTHWMPLPDPPSPDTTAQDHVEGRG